MSKTSERASRLMDDEEHVRGYAQDLMLMTEPDDEEGIAAIAACGVVLRHLRAKIERLKCKMNETT